ncbi:calcium/calmodulin-dependent protein kinase kinase 2-like [Trichoplusia ni]|uniref:Calcium/calmodulin-dependent protein kinase kinase 2-like n=1 Tax=Trichoplusia ni TaxID=7111 RepID=A0A7E5VU91_TRINI|nr:calcium/calmodulin-dependent protein kinase kinase 2-like [Trichoplusia ni]
MVAGNRRGTRDSMLQLHRVRWKWRTHHLRMRPAPGRGQIDRGPGYTGEFQQFLNNNGIEHIFSAPYHPASNGAAENAVKICKKSIKKAIKSKSDVHSTLCRFLLAYRNTPHYTTGESPAKMLLGRNLRMRLDCLKPDQKALIRARQETVEATSSGVTRQFNPGDLVWFREYRSSNKWSAGTVIEKTGSTDYNVKSIHGTEVHRHIDQLKPRVINRTARLVDANFRNFQPVQPVKSSRSSLVFPSDNNRAPNTEPDRTNGTSLTKALVEETSRTQTDGSDLVTSEPLSTSSVPLNMPKVQETGSPRVPITRDIRTSNRTRKPVKRYGVQINSSRPQSMSLISQCGDEQVAGEYNKHFVTLKQIGKGAYGCVKMAYRRSDRLLTVAKFILKDKVGAQFWVDGPDGRRLPLELSLLLTLKHPNIVSVLEVFENEKYFQMVMEKHGAGMDLFEFIERRPRLDEPLLSYIFRQIGQAVEYLHSLNILHRDIKDENVIIDNKFHVKLIDFGSATFMSKDMLFSTFYGTTEYCSPEVLAGNKYAGPELEMWSMGITLYVLTFFVNPFSDIEDTIQGPLAFPQLVSEDLEQLLRWMLCKEPSSRCTITQLMAHPWIRQPVAISNYVFHEIVDCDRHEANPEMYFSGSLGSPRSISPVSLADPLIKERSHPSEPLGRSEGRAEAARDAHRRAPPPHAPHAPSAERDAHSDNYSLRSSADILDISSKPVSDAALTDISSDATGHAACDIDYDCDQYECDSWDECEQDSFS